VESLNPNEEAQGGPLDPPSTRFLYVQAHAGDGDSLEQLLQRIRPRLESWAATRLGPALRSRVQVDDVVQEIMIKAYAAIPSFEPRGRNAFYGWLFAIAQNTIRDHARKLGAAKRDIKREEPVHSNIVGMQTTPSGRVSRSEAQQQFLEALADLPERYRDVLRMRKLEHMSTEETAQRLGITPKNVTVLLSRARQALAQRLTGSA